ncbi:hypothetical protein LUZ60_017560 [Juncus effusus]|nr:hypothetical protein LUZ60_017560 [Juncus effusus]
MSETKLRTRPVKPEEKETENEEEEKKAGPMLRRREFLLRSNLSMDASCSSDVSSDSFCSRASTGRIRMGSGAGGGFRRRKSGKVLEVSVGSGLEGSAGRRMRCAWVTANSDPCYVAFHDEEWGVPVHDDKKLFEMLVLSGALAELTWPAILSKRHIFREVFMDFDPALVAKINEKKLAMQGSLAGSLLSETKLRGIVENAREVLKIIQQFGSFNQYIWGFTNHKPIVGRFRYQRQVPVKTPKADFISKDLVRRGFRGVGPTIIYSFMQVCGLTNDHLLSCFRFEECNTGTGTGTSGNSEKGERIGGENEIEVLVANVDELSIS